MNGIASPDLRGRPQADEPAPFLTLVDLIWDEKHIEHWIRFGHEDYRQHLDPQRSIVGFAPGRIIAFVRWAGNDHGTVASRLDVLRTVGRGERCQTVPFVRPGAEILLRQSGWSKVERVLLAIDAIEALGLDPADVSPDHWRHLHNRLTAGEEPRSYTRAQHAAWLKRREVQP